ncbi:MAG: hypothetical protein HY901_37995 [Deltaproteobacteria bacterium]|nr:hypothetical protein [Deltaproteobacteria bacterium]
MAAPQSSSPVPGHLRLKGADGAELEAADATFEPQEDALVVHPRQQAVLRVDFADVDGFEVGDYVFALKLASGERIEASMLGRRFGELCDATASALTAFQARNLLLQESVGGETFSCDVAREGVEAAGEVRVYATSVAVIPKGAVPYGLPLGEMTSVGFDEGRYSVDLTCLNGTVSLLRLGRRTQPCARLIESRLTELRTRTAEALAWLVPQLPTLTARRFAQALPDGVPARKAQLDAISPAIWPALVQAAIGGPKLKESFEALAQRCSEDEVAVGIKETNARQDVVEEGEGTDPSGAADVDAALQATPERAGSSDEPRVATENPMTGRVVWFAFPVLFEDRSKPGNAVAIEAVTRGGRATYLFRIAPPEIYREASSEELTRLSRERITSVSLALVALGFKREPLYLPEERIHTGPYARYRLALRLSAALKAARASFVGRAIHGPGWASQIEAALERARG